MQDPQSAARLGHLFRQTRQSQNLSIRQLGSRAGVPPTTIVRIEQGEIARPRPDTLGAISHALALPLADVYAVINYAAPTDLPSFAPYLRARYGELSPAAIERLTSYFADLAAKDGVRLQGPANGEDEAR